MKEAEKQRKGVRHSLFKRFLMIVVILLLCMIGSFLAVDYTVRKMAESSTLSSNEKILQQIDAKTKEFHNSIYNMLTLLAYEQTTYQYFTQSQRERLGSYEDLQILLSNMMMIQNDIAGISLYDGEGGKLTTLGKDFEVFNRAPVETNFAYSNVFRPNSSSEAYFTISYPVYDLPRENYDRQIGMIVLVMRGSWFSSYLKDTAITENEHVYLVDKRNMVIAGDQDKEFYELDVEGLRKDKNSLIQTVDQEETSWRIVSVIPVREIYSGLSIVHTSILLVMTITFLGLSLLLYFCYFIIIRPIRRVDAFVRHSAASSTERLEGFYGTDEISILVDNLNHMLDEKDEMSEKLRHAQRDLYETELSKQQMQVLAYRNQINPHFLYNTFECIRAMALYYDADEIAEITMALSRIFRYAIKGHNIVTVEEEIANIREYAKIIFYRFGGRIQVGIEVEEEAKKRNMLKLIIQPVVENSIFHGLEQKLDNGLVTVHARVDENDMLEVEVKDDGCGMEQEQVDQLLYQIKRQSLHRSSQKDSIGLANICHRLGLFYGDKADFTIESSPGKGTRVIIKIPRETEERMEECTKCL